MRLLTITAKDHPDYHNLRYTVTCVSSMVQARESQLNQDHNEAKLEQVQARFPFDDLRLSEPLEAMEVCGGRGGGGGVEGEWVYGCVCVELCLCLCVCVCVCRALLVSVCVCV